MKKERRIFTKEFKTEAVRLAGQRGMAAAAKALDVGENLLYRWRQKLEEEGADAFRGQGNRTGLEEENRQLRLENRRLREEAEILKKAAAYFAKLQR